MPRRRTATSRCSLTTRPHLNGRLLSTHWLRRLVNPKGGRYPGLYFHSPPIVYSQGARSFNYRLSRTGLQTFKERNSSLFPHLIFNAAGTRIRSQSNGCLRMEDTLGLLMRKLSRTFRHVIRFRLLRIKAKRVNISLSYFTLRRLFFYISTAHYYRNLLSF